MYGLGGFATAPVKTGVKLPSPFTTYVLPKVKPKKNGLSTYVPPVTRPRPGTIVKTPTIMPVLKPFPFPESVPSHSAPPTIMPAVPPFVVGGSGASGGGGDFYGGGSGGDGEISEAGLVPTGGLEFLKNIPPVMLLGAAVALFFAFRKSR